MPFPKVKSHELASLLNREADLVVVVARWETSNSEPS
jgi:hypothetical protein